MATTKQRINITVEPDMGEALLASARQDKVPVASKAHDLLRLALEIEEDLAWAKLVNHRLKMKGTIVSHKKTWGLK